MVVQGLIALALAGPTGGLFGLAYGTAIRVGYEIIYPLLFNSISRDVNESLKKDATTTTTTTEGATAITRQAITSTGTVPRSDVPDKIAQVLKGLTEMYSTVGGLEANAFGINTGVKNAMKAIQDDPELLELLKKNSNLLGQNITVNLSGTGLIDESGKVTSDPVDLELDPIEELEVIQIIDENQQKAGDALCMQEYGSAYSVAGYDINKNMVSCKKIVGGIVVSRQPWPPVKAGEFVTPTPEDEMNIRKEIKMVIFQPIDGSLKNLTFQLTEFELDQLIRQTKTAIKKFLPTVKSISMHRTLVNNYFVNLKEYIHAMQRVFIQWKYTQTEFYP